MKIMPDIDEVAPTELRIVEVEEKGKPVKKILRLFYMDSTCHAISGGMWNVT
jgi:hypothetical protein